MSQVVNRSKDYYNLLNNIIENELNPSISNNEVLWVAMGYELEIQGVEKIQISTIMRKDIEDMLYEKQFKEFMLREEYKWHNGSYWLVTKKNGWTNPSMARNVSSDPVQDQGNSSIDIQNANMIVLCYDIINICRTIIERSKAHKPLEDIFGEKIMKEFYKQRHTIINNCKNAIDNKTKVPRNTELFLLDCLATVVASTNKCAQVFMEQNLMRLKDQGKFLTLKQATKFQKGGRQSQLNILKPVSQDTALFLDYSGIQCTCGGWRIRDKPDSKYLECYDCDNVLTRAHISKCEHCQIPLYTERLLYMVNNKNKCQNCDAVNDLPDELIQSLKSKT